MKWVLIFENPKRTNKLIQESLQKIHINKNKSSFYFIISLRMNNWRRLFLRRLTTFFLEHLSHTCSILVWFGDLAMPSFEVSRVFPLWVVQKKELKMEDPNTDIIIFFFSQVLKFPKLTLIINNSCILILTLHYRHSIATEFDART